MLEAERAEADGIVDGISCTRATQALYKATLFRVHRQVEPTATPPSSSVDDAALLQIAQRETLLETERDLFTVTVDQAV